MTRSIDRRRFIRTTSTTLALFGAIPGPRGAEAPSRRLTVGVIGLGRGQDHVNALRQIAGVEVAWLCDVDANRLAQAAKSLDGKQDRTPKTTQDFRRILEDPTVDAVTIAAPNFWHAPATILACAAGKHVYVEKPESHNAREGS
jgi:predicted dehydrogenase